MEYGLNHWNGKDDDPERVAFQAPDLDDKSKLTMLTDKVLFCVSDRLEAAKQSDPRGFYKPIRHFPSTSGDEIYVLRDGFNLLKDDFVDLVQGLYNEFLVYRVRSSSRP